MGIGGSDWSTRIHCDFEMLSLVPIWKTIDNEVFPVVQGYHYGRREGKESS